MQSPDSNPTPYPDVNSILGVLLKNVQDVLGSHFIGMYLDGSLTSDAFDEDSDIDFVVVTDEDISADLFLALQAMHDQIATIDSYWATQMEGTYVSQHAIRRYDPAYNRHPHIQRGRNERLAMLDHSEEWTVHRHIVRERGITISGPSPQTLIDPISPDDLRQAMRGPRWWLTRILNNRSEIAHRGWQSTVVLILCRILYTLETGDVVSKPAAASWAKEVLDAKWKALIDSTWEGRHHPGDNAQPDAINATLDFIRFTLQKIDEFDASVNTLKR